jgi:hypothetical protein
MPQGSSEKRWSYSRITCYEMCPARYHRRYIEKMEATWSSEVTGFGRLFHELAEEYAKHCFDCLYGSDIEHARRMALRYAATEYDSLATCFVSWAERTQFDWDSAVADGDSVERWMERRLPNGTNFCGKLDLVLYDKTTGSLITHDYKTSWVPPKWNPEAPPFQHICYAWLGLSEWPAKSCVARVEYVRRGGEPLHEWELEPPLDWIEQALQDRIAAVDDNNTALKPGTHCGWCEYVVGCQIEDVAELILQDADDVGGAWEVLEGLRAKTGALSRMVRDWVTENGPIYLEDGRLLDLHGPAYADAMGRVAKISPGMLMETLTCLRGFGISPEKMVSVSTAKLMRALEDVPEIGEFVEETSPTRSLAARKPQQ